MEYETTRQRPKGVVVVVSGPASMSVIDTIPHDSVEANVVDGAPDAGASPDQPVATRARQYKSNPEETWRMLGYAKERGESVTFRIDIGWLLPGVVSPSGGLIIESILPHPITVQVTIEHISSEPENPQGIAILARVKDVVNHSAYFPGGPERMDLPVIKSGSLLQLSYSLTSAEGGLCVVDEQDPYNNQPPLINSLSEICRLRVEQSDANATARYQISSTRTTQPTTNSFECNQYRPLEYG